LNGRKAAAIAELREAVEALGRWRGNVIALTDQVATLGRRCDDIERLAGTIRDDFDAHQHGGGNLPLVHRRLPPDPSEGISRDEYATARCDKCDRYVGLSCSADGRLMPPYGKCGDFVVAKQPHEQLPDGWEVYTRESGDPWFRAPNGSGGHIKADGSFSVHTTTVPRIVIEALYRLHDERGEK
jgi:hypothetical protein